MNRNDFSPEGLAQSAGSAIFSFEREAWMNLEPVTFLSLISTSQWLPFYKRTLVLNSLGPELSSDTRMKSVSGHFVAEVVNQRFQSVLLGFQILHRSFIIAYEV